jgi:hypothetical protein
MGKKRTSTRTLPSGERVRHHPDGTQTLVSESKADRFLKAVSDNTEKRMAELDAALLGAISEKRAELEAGDAVPDDKRPI